MEEVVADIPLPLLRHDSFAFVQVEEVLLGLVLKYQACNASFLATTFQAVFPGGERTYEILSEGSVKFLARAELRRMGKEKNGEGLDAGGLMELAFALQRAARSVATGRTLVLF